MLNYLENVLASLDASLGNVLHVGAGICSELDIYRMCGANRVLLVEGDPVQLESLRARTLVDTNVEIEPRVAAADDRESVEFNVCNDRRCSATSKPGFIREIFPNLEIASQQTLPAANFSELASRMQEDADGLNLLVLDTVGNELELLRSLPKPILQAFHLVAFVTGSAPLYSGGPHLDELAKFLRQHLFSPVYCTESSAGLRENLYRFDDRAAVLHRALAEETSARNLLKQRLGEAEDRYSMLASEIETLRNENDHLLNELKESRSKLHTQKAKKRQFQSELEKQSRLTKRLQEENKHSQVEIKRLTHEEKQQRDTVERLQFDLDLQNSSLRQEAERAQSLTLEIQRLQEQRDTLEAQLTELQSANTTLNSRLQAQSSIQGTLTPDLKEQVDQQLSAVSSTRKYLEQELTDALESQKKIRREAEALESVNVRLTSDLETLRSELETLQSSEASLKQLAKEQGAEVDQLRELKGQHLKEISQLRDERDDAINEIESLKKNLTKAIESQSHAEDDSSRLRSELRTLQELRDNLESQISDQRSFSKNLETERDALLLQGEKLSAELANLTDAHNSLLAEHRHTEELLQELEASVTELQLSDNDLHETSKNLRAELEAANHDRALANKMVAKTQIDLEELRKRYEHKARREQQLVELISQLREKLELASHYYFQLQEKHPELLAADGDSITILDSQHD